MCTFVMSDSLQLDNPVFASYVFYSTASMCKMLAMVPITMRLRGINPPKKEEESSSEVAKVSDTTADLELARRSHLNDVENIPLFILLGPLYIMTGPNPTCAKWHFRLYFLARLLHTVGLLHQVPHRLKCIGFITGYSLTCSMALQILREVISSY